MSTTPEEYGDETVIDVDPIEPEDVAPVDPPADTPDAPPVPADDPQDDPETFPREYVLKLRREAAEARVRAKRTDDLEAALFTERVRSTGRLADPSDLPFDAALLDDDDALTAAIDALTVAKPHMASRRPFGRIGQGATTGTDTVSLAGILRSNA